MSYLNALLVVHTLLSLVAIASGAAAVIGLFRTGSFRSLTRIFLVTAAGTSITGFFFPESGVTPAMIVGAIALIILAIVLLAYYRFRLTGSWRWIYAAGMVSSLYLLVFVGVVQAFQKIALLNAIAPTQSETPFVVAQIVTLVLFLAVGALAVRSYQPDGLEATL